MGEIKAHLSEIFSSLQGEGPHAGEPMTFVRLAGCSLACKWCDTETAAEAKPFCRIETPPRSKRFISEPNPVSVERLNEHLAFFSDPVISITGGEPLEQAEFIAAWLSTSKNGGKILLETNGIFPAPLDKVAKYVDIISMDIKLPSSTGGRAYWKEHSAFLTKALQTGKETYIKIVVTPDTTDKDIQEAIKLVTSANKYIPIILQPASETGAFRQKISEKQIQSFARLCHLWLPNVSVMRQAHKELGIL